MPRAKNAKADEALALYRQGLKLVEIARQLEVPEGTVRRWKCTHDWDGKKSERSEKKTSARKRGGQPGNRNRAAPKGNRRAEKFGFYNKYLPEETLEIFAFMEAAEMSARRGGEPVMLSDAIESCGEKPVRKFW